MEITTNSRDYNIRTIRIFYFTLLLYPDISQNRNMKANKVRSNQQMTIPTNSTFKEVNIQTEAYLFVAVACKGILLSI